MKTLLLFVVLAAPERPALAPKVELSHGDPLVLDIMTFDIVRRPITFDDGFGPEKIGRIGTFSFQRSWEVENHSAQEFVGRWGRCLAWFHWTVKVGRDHWWRVGVWIWEKVPE